MYEFNQIRLFHSMFLNQSTSCLYISCFKEDSLVSTTIDSKNLFFYEMCIRNSFPIASDSSSPNIIPLSCMLTTNPTCSEAIHQWLQMFLNSEKHVYQNYYAEQGGYSTSKDSFKYIICDNSMSLVETILNTFNNEDFCAYSNRCLLNNLTCFHTQKQVN